MSNTRNIQQVDALKKLFEDFFRTYQSEVDDIFKGNSALKKLFDEYLSVSTELTFKEYVEQKNTPYLSKFLNKEEIRSVISYLDEHPSVEKLLQKYRVVGSVETELKRDDLPANEKLDYFSRVLYRYKKYFSTKDTFVSHARFIFEARTLETFQVDINNAIRPFFNLGKLQLFYRNGPALSDAEFNEFSRGLLVEITNQREYKSLTSIVNRYVNNLSSENKISSQSKRDLINFLNEGQKHIEAVDEFITNLYDHYTKIFNKKPDPDELLVILINLLPSEPRELEKIYNALDTYLRFYNSPNLFQLAIAAFRKKEGFNNKPEDIQMMQQLFQPSYADWLQTNIIPDLKQSCREYEDFLIEKIYPLIADKTIAGEKPFSVVRIERSVLGSNNDETNVEVKELDKNGMVEHFYVRYRFGLKHGTNTDLVHFVEENPDLKQAMEHYRLIEELKGNLKISNPIQAYKGFKECFNDPKNKEILSQTIEPTVVPAPSQPEAQASGNALVRFLKSIGNALAKKFFFQKEEPKVEPKKETPSFANRVGTLFSQKRKEQKEFEPYHRKKPKTV